MIYWKASESFARLTRIVVFVLGAVSLCGCVNTSLSRAYVDPGIGWSSETAGRGQRIIGPAVDIYVKASNSISNLKDETKSNTFGVSLYFIPQVENIEFIPSGVSLLLTGSPAIKPMRYDLMVTGNNSGLDIWDCGHYNYPLVNLGSGPQYILRRGFCAELYFDVRPPTPETEFVLRISGLTRNGEQIRVPDLRFKKGGVRTVDFPIR